MTISTPRASGAKRILAASAAVAIALLGVVGIAAPAQAVSSVVTNLNDAGAGSLRDAVTLANSDPAVDTITFQPGLTGTVALTGTLTITESLVIDGTGADITVSRVNGSSFDLIVANFTGSYNSLSFTGFEISNDADAPLDLGRGLAVFNSNGNDIGAITLADMVFANHDGGNPSGGGGAISIYESTNVTITGGSISSNQVDPGYSGGGLYFEGGNYGSLTIDGTTFASNVAGEGGAFFVTDVNGVTVTDAVFQLNSADGVFPEGFGGAASISDVASDGVQISGTTFSENDSAIDGGAVFVFGNSGPLIVSDSVFGDDTAQDGSGGGLFVADTGAVTVENTSFTNEFAEAGGGGAYIDDVDGAVLLAALTVEGNATDDDDAGGVYVGLLTGALTVTGSAFVDNAASNGGGGLYVNALPVASTISDSRFVGNTTGDTDGGGAFVFALNADLTITRTTFEGNAAETGGSGLHVAAIAASATLAIDSSTFAQNSPTSASGVATSLYVGTADGTVDISQSTFSETAAGLPAIYFDTNSSTSLVDVSQSTIVAAESGLVIRDMSTSDFFVGGSIIVGGAGNAIDVQASQGGIVNLYWSLISTALGPDVIDVVGNLLSTNPDLGPLASNGGPTQTRLPLAGSAAINRGDPTFVALPPAVDQRGTGFSRVVGGRVDLGAVEVQAAALAATGQTVSWWLLPVAGGVVLLGVIALVVVRLRGSGRRRA